MIKSMTGFGRAGWEDESCSIQVEVKTLNSKFFDVSLRTPRQFSDKEIELRNLLQSSLERGKVNVSVDFVAKKSTGIPATIDEDLFAAYISKFRAMAHSVAADTDFGELFKLALQAPLVMNQTPTEEGDAGKKWESVRNVLQEALRLCNQFRADEGQSLFAKLEQNIQVIRQAFEQVKSEEGNRKERIKSRIRGNFQEWMEENSFDSNRFEQELIYYFEKLDITEELVRLETHLDYFQKVMNEELAQGKKLGFISQEIGREINTIGSKANDATIQKLVVLMKDELEKIKEQSMNVL